MSEYTHILTTDGELYHYGVKGMKWGKRTASDYSDKARTHASKIASSKTRLGKEYHNYRAYRNDVKAAQKSHTKEGFLRDLDNKYGHGAYADVQNASSKYYDRKSNYTKTRLGTTMAKSKSYNNKTAAKANERLHKSENIKEYGKNYIDSFANRKIKTWSGRTTTTGKQMVDKVMTGGLAGTVADYGHYIKTGKKSKDRVED